jgi:diguanylate cyclase (GGDEF)-like protein/PAS domain S-box-containing protein
VARAHTIHRGLTTPRLAALVSWARRWLPRGSSLPAEVWERRHRGILVLLWAHIPALFAFGVIKGVGVPHAIFETSIVASLALMASIRSGGRRLSTVIASVGLLTCSAELVHLSGGVIEMHFHYFVMVGVITLYQDWYPFLVAIGYVVFQHGVAGVVSPESVYNHQAAVNDPWTWAGIHGLFILGLSAAGIVSWKLNEGLLAAASEREQRLAEAQEVARMGSWEVDLRTRDVAWSDGLYRLLELRPGQTVTNDMFVSRVHPDDRQAVIEAVTATFNGGAPHALDFRVVLADGTERWLHLRGDITERLDGEPVTMAGTIQDVSERRRSEDAIRRSQGELQHALSLLTATLDSTADGILVVDMDGKVTSSNRQFAEMWRLPEEIVASKDDFATLSYVMGQIVDPDGFHAKVRELYAHPEAESYDSIAFKDGRVFERFSRPQRVAGEIVGRVWSFRDVTEHTRLEAELAHQAFHDSLTGLANQALFRDRVDHALARLSRSRGHLAVLFLDLDNFKHVNDSLGHTSGDLLLGSVTARLLGSVRPADTAARMGGDEFAVLLEDLADPADAVEAAERIIAALQDPFLIEGNEVVATASIGVAHAGSGITGEQLLANADLAMYTAKGRGKGRCEVFESEMHTAAVERLQIEADLRRAQARGELVVHYQPIVELASGRTTGVEALVRWQHPTRGLLGPGAFIPLAEENGVIDEIGRWVLTEACRQVQQWRVEYEDTVLSASVNLSPRQLLDSGLDATVAAVLQETGLPASALTLEITETAMMRDTEAAIRNLAALKALGVKLAVDDFGTGYSSLAHLQRFPIDVLKIDRSFVSTIESGPEASSLARAIVRLAQTLHLIAIAEGVETAEQQETLRALGCHLAQGYYLARPLPADQLAALLRDEVAETAAAVSDTVCAAIEGTSVPVAAR